MSSRVKVLVAISSAGVDPWLEIETKFQIPYLLGVQSDAVSFIWFRQNRPATLGERVFGTLQRGYKSAISWNNKVSKALRAVDWEAGPILPWGNHHARHLMKAELEKPSTRPKGGHGIVHSDFPNIAWLVPARIGPHLAYCLNNFEFTHILRTTSTSLIHAGNLIKWASEAGNTGVYSGKSIPYLGGLEFIGGSGVLLSRDVTERIVVAAERLRFDLYGDVALGRLLPSLGVFPQSNKCEASVTRLHGDSMATLRGELDQGVTVIRCKPFDWSRSPVDVIQIMQRVAQEMAAM